MSYPRIHLAIDNCFASKRWTHPRDWMAIARDIGIYHIEASADNECDPLYSTPDALTAWRDAVRSASDETGVRVANFYSGHGTYATLGLSHPDIRVRDHMQHRWLAAMIQQAGALGAGLGFFCHAFDQPTLNDPDRYAAAYADLVARLAALAQLAEREKLTSLSVEQMYAPHQPPWTLRGAADLLRRIYAEGGAPFYLSLDLGHAVGQRHFQRPTLEQIDALYTEINRDQTPSLWLGGLDPAAHTPETLADAVVARDALFALPEDGDPYAWLREFGAYGPIIHLQQTDGTASAHRPFTAAYNKNGIIDPARVLRALKESYDQPEPAGMPPRVTDIYLTLEIFAGTAQRYDLILRDIAESAAFWRAHIPQDGLPLDTLVDA